VDEVELPWIVHTRYIFFLERFMKVLKGYVPQKARLEGGMAEGWLVKKSTFYVTEFLFQIRSILPRFCEI